ncbi:RhoGAP-domain-containing protein [Backusella circina FSU 941]|nr:RhoGAP-domain-containing protein [Backusella circina FSU 941]
MKYVELDRKCHSDKHVERLKTHIQQLHQFKTEQERQRNKNRAWMRDMNVEYTLARVKKHAKAKEEYMQKWEDMDRSTGYAVASPMLSTPTSPFPVLTKSLSMDTTEDVRTRAMSLDSERVRINGSSAPQSRLERLKKQFGHLKNQEDPTKHNIKVANLKVEVGEADTNYRNVVREISNLALKNEASHKHILKTVQTSLEQKSQHVKAILESALSSNLLDLEASQKYTRDLLKSVQAAKTDVESNYYYNQVVKKHHPKPSPVFYINYHVGECKHLIFGTSLQEYAQQHGRSPPLLITKCIEAIERLGGLEREGIYRVPGKQSNMEKIKHAFEKDEEAAEIGQNDLPEDIFSISSVIKIFLRELQSPLFPFKLTDRLVYSQIPDQELRLMNLLTRLLKLPPANYDTLRALIDHLARLEQHVEKNKMNISNLTLIFTPAIFQDLNHAQNSPGEWAKDCVLEDLIRNHEELFANKDFHSNSAITGTIESISEHPYSPSDRYAVSITSPDSPTEDEYPTPGDQEDNEDHEDHEDQYGQEAPETEELVPENTFTSSTQPPLPSVPTEKLNHSGSIERKKYQNRFQEMGLKVDTTKNTKPSAVAVKEVPVASVKSATVPSRDWLQFDPELNSVPVPKLRRSATTGKKVMSRRKLATADLPPFNNVEHTIP